MTTTGSSKTGTQEKSLFKGLIVRPTHLGFHNKSRFQHFVLFRVDASGEQGLLVGRGRRDDALAVERHEEQGEGTDRLRQLWGGGRGTCTQRTRAFLITRTRYTHAYEEEEKAQR